MQPRLGTLHRQQVRQRRLPHTAAPSPAALQPPWRLTRRLSTSDRLTLFRSAAANELGPGCYVLKTTAAADDALVHAMLQRECVVSSDVSHPNLNSVLATELCAARPFLVFPYLEGITLRRLIDSRSAASHALPISYALSLVRQIAEALSAIHTAGWLHGQVCPEHIIISPLAHATLIDLTLARRLETDECDPRHSYIALNNRAAAYAAPESFSPRRRQTAAADTYSLGIVLFELLASQPPFVAKSLRQLAICHQSHVLPDLRQMRPGLAHGPADLVACMLAKEPLRRPSDDQLIRWLAELEISELAL